MLVASLLSAVLAWSILRLLLGSGWASRIAVDTPNHRSLHTVSTPRVGGLALIGAAFIVASILLRQMSVVLVIAALLLALSAIDDRRGLPVAIRLAAHVAAASLFLGLTLPSTPWWALALLAAALVWSINLYNFMDGSDGLAGGMAMIGFGALALAGLRYGGATHWALTAACLAGAAGGFLAYNFPPARVFLGDAGSVPLGFLAGALGVLGWRDGAWPAWFPLLVFSPFLVDATLTLTLRVSRGEKPWQAHREHLYQRMIRSGFGPRRTALAWYGVMLACALSGALAISWPFKAQIALLGLWAVFYAVAFGSLRRAAQATPE